MTRQKVRNPLNPFGNVRKMRPTKGHRAAIWECMLGTVYAANPDGDVQYFDYNYDEAVSFAELSESDDLRFYRQGKWNQPRFRTGTRGDEGPRSGQIVLWQKAVS